jgi:acyl dehydratase
VALTHRVRARNDAEHSENKIHDDAVARQYGFKGGLVPGVTVYGFLTWAPVSTWGMAWLEAGAMSARFVKPVYDGDDVDVRVEQIDDSHIDVSAVSWGEVCATGAAWMPDEAAPAAGVGGRATRPVPAPADRPPADEQSLAVGTTLATIQRMWDATERASYLDVLSDDLDVYDRQRIAHPGGLIRAANEVLARSVLLGPWIHVSSTALNHGVVPDGSTVTTYGRVVDIYERKGHRFVDLDVLSAVADRAVLSVQHTAIYAPRKS